MQAIQNTQTASTQVHNIFVVNEDTKKAGMLRKFIKERFQNKVNVYMYFSSKSCLRMIHENVHLVIIDYFNDSKKGNLLLKDIKALYPNMDVIFSFEVCIITSMFGYNAFISFIERYKGIVSKHGCNNTYLKREYYNCC